MASLTKLFHISRCTHRYTTLVCLWTSWGKFRFPSGFRMPRRYPVHRAIMSPWWTIKYTHVCREWKGWGGGAKEKEKDGNLEDFLSRETIRLLYSSIKSGRNWRILFSFWVDRPPNFAWKFVYKFDLICENELIKMNRIGFWGSKSQEGLFDYFRLFE